MLTRNYWKTTVMNDIPCFSIPEVIFYSLFTLFYIYIIIYFRHFHSSQFQGSADLISSTIVNYRKISFLTFAHSFFWNPMAKMSYPNHYYIGITCCKVKNKANTALSHNESIFAFVLFLNGLFIAQKKLIP